jgi:hypothetical protein
LEGLENILDDRKLLKPKATGFYTQIFALPLTATESEKIERERERE